MTLTGDLQVMSDFLARRDVAGLTEPVDLIVLMGSAVIESVEVVASAYQSGVAQRILISGGIGHSTRYLVEAIERRKLDVATTGRPESHIFADLLRDQVDLDAITIEDQSTNCGQNAEFASRLITDEKAVVLVQDPTMQRRTHASFERACRDRRHLELISFAPVLPRAGTDVGDRPDAIWSTERFTSLVLGEIRRLRDDADGYGPRGRDFIDQIDVPADVLVAYHNVAARNRKLVR